MLELFIAIRHKALTFAIAMSGSQRQWVEQSEVIEKEGLSVVPSAYRVYPEDILEALCFLQIRRK